MFNTYVINLDSQGERFDVQSRHLRAAGLSRIVRVRGHTPDEIPLSERNRYFKNQAFMPGTNMACAYSHLQTLRRFVETDPHDVALVLEDDAFPLVDAETLRKKLRGEWDLLMLHCDGFCPTSRAPAGRMSASMAAYFVTKEGARKLLRHKYDYQFDIDTSHLGDVRKIVEPVNSFWTDEDAEMSGKFSVNRKDVKYCPSVLKRVKGNRGEKNVCHAMWYKIFRIPGIGYEVTSFDVIVVLLFFGIFSRLRKRR
jgi:GR25 family glycosyltransferase involved in LPS biosynthesis